MKNRNLILLVMLMFIWSSGTTVAQFYDKEDDILFYVMTERNGDVYDIPTECLVLNFDGSKATFFDWDFYSIEKVKMYLRNDPEYFEKKVYSADYTIQYTNKYPATSYIFSLVSPYNSSYYSKYLLTFSSDRKQMVWKALNGSVTKKYRLVPKSYFLPGRSRTE